MPDAPFNLRGLSIPARLGLTCLLLTVLGGLASSAVHVVHHYENRDELPDLTFQDFEGAYHGVRTIAPLIVQLKSGHPTEIDPQYADILSDKDRDFLLRWLGSDRISEDYDNLDLGDLAPVEIIDQSCLDCHSRIPLEDNPAEKSIPLEYWDDVKKVAFSRTINPASIEIMLTSTHTHALGMATLALIIAILTLMSSLPKRFRHGCLFVIGISLMLDLGSWWIARIWVGGVWIMLFAGMCFGISMTITTLALMLDLWLPPSKSITQ